MKICMYGSGNKKTPKEYTDVGYKLGLEIAEKGHSLVFGGGNYGMMGAVASGVFDNGGEILAIFPEWIMEFDDQFSILRNLFRQNLWMREKNYFWKNLTYLSYVPADSAHWMNYLKF